MTKVNKSKQEDNEPMKTWSMKISNDQLTEAKGQAEREGRSLATVVRKMLNDWLSGEYKPFNS